MIKDEHKVTAIDNFSTGRASNLVKLRDENIFSLIKGSILDTTQLNTLVKEADYNFNLDAAVGVLNIVNNPIARLLTNILRTENVLEAAVETGTTCLPK